jgi:hypothetical protein
MNWQGKELKTLGDILDAVTKCATREEAQEFMRQYREFTPHAAENIGYLGGYCSDETNMRIQDWFGVEHPIFGKTTPTPKEAFNAGVRMAKGLTP